MANAPVVGRRHSRNSLPQAPANDAGDAYRTVERKASGDRRERTAWPCYGAWLSSVKIGLRYSLMSLGCLAACCSHQYFPPGD